MARPRKKGLDYLPLDVHFFDDRRIRKLNTKYSGGKASFVFLRLVTEIYQNGYYIELTEDDFKFLAYESKIRKDVFEKILYDLLDHGFFDKDIYEKYSVLTSEDIQRQYFSIKNSSKSALELTETDAKFLLIEIGNYKNIRIKTLENDASNTEQTNGKSVDIPTENQRKTQESKEKKSKEKVKGEKSKAKSTENERKIPPLNEKDLKKFNQEILSKFPEYLRPSTDAELLKWINDYHTLREQLSHDDIVNLVNFGLKDEFWKQNFVSLSYLLSTSRKDGVPMWKKFLTQAKTSNTQHNPQPVNTNVTVY